MKQKLLLIDFFKIKKILENPYNFEIIGADKPNVSPIIRLTKRLTNHFLYLQNIAFVCQKLNIQIIILFNVYNFSGRT